MKLTPWLLSAPVVTPRMRLYCFSYAGGSAAVYLPWQRSIGTDIQVVGIQLPGRGARITEPPCTSLPDLVDAICDVVADEDLPFSFFGHSLGGVLAFEVARRCTALGRQGPRQLFVSGAPAPQLRGERRNIHLLPDRDLIEVLGQYQGTPPAVLANEELMQLLLPVIRADFSLVEAYRYCEAPLLDIPVVAFAGRADEITSAQMHGWATETTGAFELNWFDGGHFFINDHRDRIATRLAQQMLEPAGVV